MAQPNLGAAAQQTSWMLQVVNRDVLLSENMDEGADLLFADTPIADVGLQQYRHGIQTEVGGQAGVYQPDGGSYPQGQASQEDQFIVAPIPIIVVIAATELARRISAGGKDLVVENWVSKMIADVKIKTAHTRNAYMQQYNNGILATVDASYTSGTTVQLAKTPFGGRLLDRLGQYQVTDTNLNVVGTVNVIDVQKNGVGTIDTVTIDVAPGGLAAGYNFIPTGLASGTPILNNGLNYIVNTSTALEYCGVSRANSYVQSPGFNANGAFLTLAATEAFMVRMSQATGVKRFKERKSNVWYTHTAQKMSANVLGFAKTFYMASDGKLPANYDIGTDYQAEWQICGMKVVDDSMAAVDKLYWIDKKVMKRVRYPGSQKFIPFGGGDIFWPRQSGGLWVSESDAMYQDSFNAYSSLPWASGIVYNLGIQPSLSN